MQPHSYTLPLKLDPEVNAQKTGVKGFLEKAKGRVLTWAGYRRLSGRYSKTHTSREEFVPSAALPPIADPVTRRYTNNTNSEQAYTPWFSPCQAKS